MSDKADFSRQSFLGPNSESLLASVRVAIVGLGGGGSQIGQQLAHMGVGNFRLLDPQTIEPSNLNRLVGATQNDVARCSAKVDIVRRTIIGIRPRATVAVAKTKWQDATHLLRDAHVIFGCVDGFRQREALERAARRFCIPYIDIGMDVVEVTQKCFAISGQMIMTRPGRPCLTCLGFLNSQNLSQEENRYGDAGINPQVVWTNGTLASLAVGAFVKMVTPWSSFDDDYTWLELDGNRQTVTPSRRPQYMPIPDHCPHHGGTDGLGDPFFSIATS